MKFTRSKLVQKDAQFLIWEYRGLSVICDRKRIVPNDPGADTPAMVYYKRLGMEASATYWCAISKSKLQITRGKNKYGSHKLSENQIEWLASLDPELTEFLYKTNPVCKLKECFDLLRVKYDDYLNEFDPDKKRQLHAHWREKADELTQLLKDMAENL